VRLSWNAADMYAAFHDSLTGLVSRRLFLDLLGAVLADVDDEPPRIAVLFIDLDHFKAVNDTLGHAAGDEVLVTVAQRLRGCLRGQDVPARLGGDEFAVLLYDITQPDVATAIADRIIEVISEPVQLRAGPARVGASIGISFSGPGAQDLNALLREADLAMYRAKRNGRGRRETHAAGVPRRALRRLP